MQKHSGPAHDINLKIHEIVERVSEKKADNLLSY
jgi:hypothetical protein